MHGNLLHVNRQDTVKRNTILFRDQLHTHTQRGAFCLISIKEKEMTFKLKPFFSDSVFYFYLLISFILYK